MPGFRSFAARPTTSVISPIKFLVDTAPPLLDTGRIVLERTSHALDRAQLIAAAIVLPSFQGWPMIRLNPVRFLAVGMALVAGAWLTLSSIGQEPAKDAG